MTTPGSRPSEDMLVNVPRLITAYYSERPDPAVRDQRVAFGTSGHRGPSLKTAFNELHILVTTRAICDYRRAQGIDGLLFLGMDTHALSEPAFATAMEVLVANGVDVAIDRDRGYTPTPVVSHSILVHNRGRTSIDPNRGRWRVEGGRQTALLRRADHGTRLRTSCGRREGPVGGRSQRAVRRPSGASRCANEVFCSDALRLLRGAGRRITHAVLQCA